MRVVGQNKYLMTANEYVPISRVKNKVDRHNRLSCNGSRNSDVFSGNSGSWKIKVCVFKIKTLTLMLNYLLQVYQNL